MYNKPAQEANAAFSTRQNSHSSLQKQKSGEILQALPSKKKYEQRKFSQPTKPTQLEIGGEGAPMLSLLPPLKTREISPRYNYTVGRKVKEQ